MSAHSSGTALRLTFQGSLRGSTWPQMWRDFFVLHMCVQVGVASPFSEGENQRLGNKISKTVKPYLCNQDQRNEMHLFRSIHFHCIVVVWQAIRNQYMDAFP